MKILKWLGYGLLGLIVICLALVAFNWDKVKRLQAVNSLFSQEKIVSNFSSMNTMFLSKEIPSSGEVTPWQVEEKTLPTSFTSDGNNYKLDEWLAASATTSMLVIENGKIASEAYYLDTKPDDLRVSWSMAKSFLSAAFGVAVSEGKIVLEASVDTYVPELADSAYKGVKVINVLNMASGVKFNEDYLDFWSDINKMGRILAIGGSMDGFVLEMKERNREQGVARQYVSIDTHVLAMVLRAATGKSLTEYVGEKIVTPLGFLKQPYYLTDSQGTAFALGGLNITTRDYARFGQMFLDGGKWQGKQIVPARWALLSTVKSAPDAANGGVFGYGFQWWIPPNSTSNGGDYLARGIYGQYIYINPKTKTVIVKTAANRQFRSVNDNGQSPAIVNVDMFRAIAKGVAQ